MAFPTTQDGGPARGCHGRHGWMPRGHSTTSPSGEHGQMAAAREDREDFLKWGTLVLKQLLAIPTGGTRARCSRPLWPTAGSRARWS